VSYQVVEETFEACFRGALTDKLYREWDYE
jgi:hypothetical protein